MNFLAKIKSFFTILILVAVTLGLSITFQSLLAAWSGPSDTAPTNTLSSDNNYFQNKGTASLPIISIASGEKLSIVDNLTIDEELRVGRYTTAEKNALTCDATNLGSLIFVTGTNPAIENMLYVCTSEGWTSISSN